MASFRAFPVFRSPAEFGGFTQPTSNEFLGLEGRLLVRPVTDSFSIKGSLHFEYSVQLDHVEGCGLSAAWPWANNARDPRIRAGLNEEVSEDFG